MKPLRVTIKDIPWTVKLLLDKDYEDKNGKGSQAITHKDDKIIEIKQQYLCTHVIKHELFHAYCSSCCIDSMTDLETHDMEEIAAEIMAYHAEDISKLSTKLYNTLKQELKNHTHQGDRDWETVYTT